MPRDLARPQSLRAKAARLADRLESPPKASTPGRSGHDVANEPRIPKGEPGGGRWMRDGKTDDHSRAEHHAATMDAEERRKALRKRPADAPPKQNPIMERSEVKEEDIKALAQNTKVGLKYVRLQDGRKVVNDQGRPLVMPEGVSLDANAKVGEEMGKLPSNLSEPFSASNLGSPNFKLAEKEQKMFDLFEHNRPMDYQRTASDNVLVVKAFIDFGNYNYGVVVAAAGYSETVAIAGAAYENQKGSGNKDGFLGGNKRNDYWIRRGYDDYRKGRIAGGSKPKDKH